jgi:hypothetical protein
MPESTEPKPYCNPNEAGLASTSRAVGRRLGRILDALDTEISWAVCSGDILEDVRDLAFKMREKLKAEGWRITVNRHDRWQVLPPLPPKRPHS